MNILADFQSAIQFINRINDALSEFKQQALEISATYKEDNPEPFLKRLDNVLSRYSHKDIFLLLSLLADDTTLNKTIRKLDNQPRDILEKVLIDPLVNDRNKLKHIIINAMLNGYIEDKEIMDYLNKKNIFVKPHSVKYNIKKLLTEYGVSRRSALLIRLMRKFY